jgi:hypothetical protein
MTMSGKMSRRRAIAVLAAAGAAIAAVPYISKVSGYVPASSSPSKTARSAASKQPLVVVVKENELLGFRGLNEFRLVDPALASTLNDAFQATKVEA